MVNTDDLRLRGIMNDEVLKKDKLKVAREEGISFKTNINIGWLFFTLFLI